MKKEIVILSLLFLVFITSCTQQTKDECNVLKGQTTIDNCYFEKAIASANVTQCKAISMGPLKEACISQISISLNDLEACNNLNETAKGSCYAKIAINNKNESICESIESDYWYNICNYEIGLAKNIEDICFKMHDTEKADECFTKIAESKKDEFSCSWILKPMTEYQCYAKLALMKGNASICNRIVDDNHIWRDGNCIKLVAEKLNDSSICNMISIKEIKQDCLNKFKK